MTCDRRGVLNITLCDKICQWLATGWCFSPGTPVSSTNKTDCHDITEILLEVGLNTITHIQGPIKSIVFSLRFNGFFRNQTLNKVWAIYFYQTKMTCQIQMICIEWVIDHDGLWSLTPLSTIFQLYRGVPGENHRPDASHWQTLSQCCIKYSSFEQDSNSQS